MVSPFSPPVLYLTDDDDDDDNNEIDPHIGYSSSLNFIQNDHLPRKKRKLINTNVHINPSVVNWSKRQRNDYYQPLPSLPPQTTTYNPLHYEPEPILNHPDEYNFPMQQNHSFHAFDWTTEPRAAPRIYSNPMQTTSRGYIPPTVPPNVMNVVKHHLTQDDTVPLISVPSPSPHQNDRYIQQHSQRKSISIPIPTTPPTTLPLPLPTPTASLIRPRAQRLQPGKVFRMPYTHPTSPSRPPPPPPPLLPTHHKQVFSIPTYRSPSPVSIPTTSYRSPSPASVSTPLSSPEIRRQALNGTGILSAFYDSKCYRCNICKFKTATSATLLQHLFTHIFFCQQCPFYSYSHHSLYQHIYEKHNNNNNNNNNNNINNINITKDNIIDPKSLDLIYITRCPDGTFALCMDTSSPPPPPAPPTQPPPPLPPVPIQPTATILTNKTDEKQADSTTTNSKRRPQKKRTTKPKKDQDADIVILSEKRDTNHQQTSAVIPKRPIPKERQGHTYVLMKHRRCYSIRAQQCLHPLTLEYNICREHTIRHMCQTQGIVKRRKFKPKTDVLILLDEVAKCLKTVVNHTVDVEENRDSCNLVCALPNSILNLLFPTDDLHTLTSSLKLTNKYEKSIEQNDLNQSEYTVRASNQHMFILSSYSMNRNQQPMPKPFPTSITNDDSVFTETKLNQLPISCDNTHRFLKGSLNMLPRPTNPTPKPIKKNDILPRPISSKNAEILPNSIPKSSSSSSSSATFPTVDKNNNSVTSAKSRSSSPTANVIVID